MLGRSESMGRYKCRGRAREEGEGKEGPRERSLRQLGRPLRLPLIHSGAARPAAATSSLVSALSLRSNLQRNPPFAHPSAHHFRSVLTSRWDLYAETAGPLKPEATYTFPNGAYHDVCYYAALPALVLPQAPH